MPYALIAHVSNNVFEFDGQQFADECLQIHEETRHGSKDQDIIGILYLEEERFFKAILCTGC